MADDEWNENEESYTESAPERYRPREFEGNSYQRRKERDGSDGNSYQRRRERDDSDGNGYQRRRERDDSDGNSYQRRRERGDAGGRDRNDAGGRDGNDASGQNNAEEGKREQYIPVDPSENVDEMFNTGITTGINFDKYDNIQIKVSGENVPKPAESFGGCDLRELLLNNLEKCGYKRPTPVQKHAIPIIKAKRDLMACAQTGSGKTASYLVPIIHELLEEQAELIMTSTQVQPQAIILSPTRELAVQIFVEAKKFSHGSPVKSCVVYGGTAVYHQAQILMRGAHIIVATPGRLNDFVNKQRISFESVKYIVLDEADRMLDMGFLPAVEEVLKHSSMVSTGDRQTLLFSATFPEEIQRLAANYMNNYLFLAVGIVGGACSDVSQTFYSVSKYDKKNKLVEILKNQNNELTLVFTETKRNADFLAAFLSENGFPTTSIHGDRLQSQREQALADFKAGRMTTLVATSVAARGLDIKNVAHVVNFDLPSSIDEYVHRIGRTGRVGNCGKATSFYEPTENSSLSSDLVKILEQAGQDIPTFLANGGISDGIYEDNSFGGKDIRKKSGVSYGNENEYSAQPKALEDEDDW